jgi:hypothetical protein
MTRWAVLLPLAAVIWVAFPLAIARFLRGPKTEEREAIGSDICKDGVHPDECPSCRPLPPPCPAVVAGDDLEWQADLAGFYGDWHRYQIEHLLPGERAS